MNLTEAKLQQRSKELDAREEYIANHEKLVKTSEHELKVTQTTLKAKQEQIDSLDADIAVKQKLVLTDIGANTARLKGLKLAISKLESNIKAKEELLVRVNKEIHERQVEKNKLLDEISERNTYYKELETKIHSINEEGNLSIKSLQYEADDLIETKKLRTNELQDLEQQKSVALDNIDKLMEHEGKARKVFAEEAQERKLQLEDLDKQLAAAQSDLDELREEYIPEKNSLNIVKEEIESKRAALQKEHLALQQEKRRFNNFKTSLNIV